MFSFSDVNVPEDQKNLFYNVYNGTELQRTIELLDTLLNAEPYKSEGIAVFSTLLHSNFYMRMIEAFLNAVIFYQKIKSIFRILNIEMIILGVLRAFPKNIVLVHLVNLLI